ncbi:hypothetical protein PI124_g1201 [Phytophthora idaei]|nr:hypothetical protein PI125_g1970 [Phytophthora idaei]KAG3169295.1 hypothetical protein PI126_g2886 [Phytophthora idaei]KAG3254233.1 hypothetical protein PI124_g1201 [Phytophthora idaei]
MAHSPAEIEERWGFLAPWCELLNGRLEYENFSYDLDVWDRRKYSIGLKLEDEELETNLASLERVREALALLAAVAHVDHAAAKYLLDKYCEVEADFTDQRVEDMFPLDFVVKRHVEKYGNVPGFQLVELCGTKQRNHPRGEYIEALKKIAALDSNLNPDGPGVDIQVPFQECFRTGFKGGTIGEFKDIVAAEKQIREEWDTYERKNKQREVEPGSLRCTLTLKPMICRIR